MSSELAWAAGFFDGDGCTYLQKFGDGRRRLRMTVGQRDIRPLLRFQQAVGEGRIQESRGQYYLRLNRSATVRTIESLWPYLSEPKREQIERCQNEEVRYRPHVF